MWRADGLASNPARQMPQDPPLAEGMLPLLQIHGLQCLWKFSPVHARCPTAIQLMCVEGVEEVAGGEVVQLVVTTTQALTQLQNNALSATNLGGGTI